MAQSKIPNTPAIRALRQAGVEFEPRPYRYQEHGGTSLAAGELGADEHAVIKTLVLEDEAANPLIVLMHGDQEVSAKALARILGVKSITPCRPQTALRHTGYQTGGISPFGLKKKLPIYLEETILNLETILINGGKKGLLVEMRPQELAKLLAPIPVRVGRKPRRG